MKHSGKATKSALKLIFWALVLLLAILSGGILANYLSKFIAALAWVLVALFGLFTAFTFYFFRDPTPMVPSLAKVVLSPGHGKVDVVDETTEPDFMGGRCKRISIFLSVVDIHVQNAPVSARVAFLKHKPGKFLSATKSHCAEHNENVLLGLESTERPGQKIGLRLIAGLIARRIVPFVSEGELITRGERISLIQFGSRCDLYLPLDARIEIKLGDRVKGGETILATFD